MARWSLADLVAAKARMEGNTYFNAPGGVRVLATPETRSKYGNKKTNGYASKKEAARAQMLKAMEINGEIIQLREQVPFELIPAQYENGKCVERACKYVADFVYVLPGYRPFQDITVVEDTKGYREPVYRLKRKLMLKVHGIRIREV
jgi:hypothetical protein